jgi:hypothetical protein
MNNPNPPGRREDPFALNIGSQWVKKQAGARIERWGTEAGSGTAWIPGLEEMIIGSQYQANPTVRAIGELLDGMLSFFGLGPDKSITTETLGEPDVNAGTIDPTDPRWPLPEGYNLTPVMARTRGASVHGSVKSGYLAPPATPGEQIVDLVAEFAPALIPAGATYGVGARLGTVAAERFLPRMALSAAAQTPKALAQFAAKRPAMVQWGGRMAGELLAGVAIGAEEGLRVQDAEFETDWGQVGEWAMWGAVGGGVFAGVAGAMTTMRALRMSRAIQGAIQQGLIPAEAAIPGLRIGELVSFARADGTLGWRHTVTGRISKAPAAEEIAAWGNQFAENFSKGAASAEQLIGEENIAKLANKPASPEGKMVQALEVQYEGTARNRVRRFAETAPESIQAEIEQWELLAADATKATIKLDALARARALRRAVGEAVPPIPGGTSYEEERALQRLLKVRPREELEGFANDMISRGQKLEGERLLELINDGLPVSHRQSANEAFMSAIEPKTRGLSRGTLVYDPEGNVAEVVQVRFGQAAIQGVNAPPGSAPIVVATEKLILVPKPGSYVQLRDGSIVKVGKVKLQDMSFSTVRRGKKPAAVYGFDQIEVVGNARRTARRLEEGYRAKRKPKQRQAETPTKVRAVDDASGEPVIVKSVSENEAVVQPVRGGKAKVVDKKNLKRSQRTARAEPPEARTALREPAALVEARNKVKSAEAALRAAEERVRVSTPAVVAQAKRGARGYKAALTRARRELERVKARPPRSAKKAAKARANAAEIKAGDQVTFTGPDGKKHTGRVVNDIEVCD